jgi:hypothetical protein
MNGPGAPSLQRAPSTADEAVPPPGAWCSCCWGTRWWRDRRKTYGWCCGQCHLPDYLKPDQMRRSRHLRHCGENGHSEIKRPSPVVSLHKRRPR